MEVAEVPKDVVEQVAAVDEGGVDGSTLCQETGQRQLRPLAEQGADRAKARLCEHLPSLVTEVGLVGVDDQLPSSARRGGNQRLGDGERRGTVGEADLDDRACAVGREEVTKNVPVGAGKRHALEVARPAESARAVFSQPSAGGPHVRQPLRLRAHERSIALAPRHRRSGPAPLELHLLDHPAELVRPASWSKRAGGLRPTARQLLLSRPCCIFLLRPLVRLPPEP